MQPNQTKYAAHILECAAIAKQVGEHLGLRDDAARQACFATVCIDAKGHGVFLEPVPPHIKTPAPKELETVPDAAQRDQAARDQAAAEKADAQVKEIVPDPTPEQADGARRSALLKGIESARVLLNKEGQTPQVTPAGLNAYIAHSFLGKTQLSELDTDDLEKLTMLLSSKLDVLREKKAKAKTSTPDDDIGF